jgi:hypothetical protein
MCILDLIFDTLRYIVDNLDEVLLKFRDGFVKSLLDFLGSVVIYAARGLD